MGRKARRKTENKIKRHEIKFQGKIINMIRFAYDVFEYSALKFGAHPTSIAVFNGPANNYVHPGFIAAVSRLVIVEQIELRESCYQLFIDHFPRYGVLSPERICSLLQEVIKKATLWKRLEAYLRVRISLCIACELIQFLNSRGSSLYLRVLPKHWFDCYFYSEKEAFEEKGILYVFYVDGIIEKNMLPDRLFDKFILLQCRDYRKSAEDVTLHEKLMCIEAYGENDLEEISEQSKSKTVLSVRLPEPLTSQRDEASGFDFPANLGLLDDATPFHNLPGASSEERPGHSRGLSAEERRRNRNYSSRPTSEQDTGHLSLDFSEMRLSSVPGAKDAAPNYNLFGAKPKEPKKADAEASDTQTSEPSLDSDISSIRPSVDQKLGEFDLDSSVKKRSSEKKPTVSSAEVPKLFRNLERKRKSLKQYIRGSSMLQTITFSNISRMKQKFSSNSSGKKESSEKRPNVLVAEDATPSDDLPEARREIPADHSQGSSGLQRDWTSLRPSVEEQLRLFSLDSSEKKESNEEKPNVAVAEDAMPSHNLLAAKPEEPAKYSAGSSGLPTSESSLYSSMEQGLGQLSLDSSGTEKSKKKRTNKSENDPGPSYSLPPASQDPAKEVGGSSSEEEKQE